MAKVYKNDKNFLVIQMTGEEASSIDFGFPVPGNLNEILCASCNKEIQHEEIFYIAAINDVACKDCADDMLKNMTHYTDYPDLKYEINHFNIISDKLGMQEKATRTPKGSIILIDKDTNEEIS